MTATATKAELTAERAKLAEKLRNRQIMDEEFKARTAQVEARLAEIDAQLARPVLPEGWVDASERKPDSDTTMEVLLEGYESATAKTAEAYKRIAWWDRATKAWRHTATAHGELYPPIRGEVACWRDIPADWLAPAEARYPRYFKGKVAKWPKTAYVRIDGPNDGVTVTHEGEVKGCAYTEPSAERYVASGDWLEITAAEAEAMVKPTVKEPFTAEATTQRLVKLLDDATVGLYGIDEGRDSIRARILAFDHSVDLRGVWEPMSDKHRDGNRWLATVRCRDSGKVELRYVRYDAHGHSDGGWYYNGGHKAYDEFIALADPAAFMPKGGGE